MEKDWMVTATNIIPHQTFASTVRTFNGFVINTQETKRKRRKKTNIREEQAFKHTENLSL